MSPSAPPAKSLNDPELKARLQALRLADNVTNWYYIARAYLYLALVIGGAVWFFEARAGLGLAWWWNVPVAIAAVVLVGAGQHQLSGLTHEGSHYILFRNRILNELASDWFCTFPLFGSTHLYRLQHLAHHQFVNDPDRDPDQAQLRSSGHRLPFPVTRGRFLRFLLAQLWVPNLVKFALARARIATAGAGSHPYVRPGERQARTAVRVGAVGVLLVLVTLLLTWNRPDPTPLAAISLGLWLGVLAAFAVLPARSYMRNRLTPPVPLRYTGMLRATHTVGLLVALAWAERLLAAPVSAYFLLLWVAPLFTSFTFFMLLRQVVQHGNADRGRLTNTRTFCVNPLINFAVFPHGQEYHLAHHLFVTIPHYRLKTLHALLTDYPEYRERGVVVEGYFFPPARPPKGPTVLEVVGPAHAGGRTEVHIENEVLEVGAFEDREAIEREGELSHRGAGSPPDRP
jgi:fatty acid desaturase